MSAKTATVNARVTTSVEPSYTELLRRVRTLFGRDVETRFEMAVIFGKMLKHKSAEDIAADTDISPGGITRIARVAEFWGSVRIKPDGAGKRPAPWFLYDQIACDPVIPDDVKEAARRAAPTKGLTYVRGLLTQARDEHVKEMNKMLRGNAAPRATAPRSRKKVVVRGSNVGAAAALGAGSTSASGVTDVVDEADGLHYVEQAIDAINDAITNLDRLESLSEEDAHIVRAKIDALVKHLLRLRG